MKKFALTLIALVLALGCALGLAACDDGKINVSIAQFDDDGIASIALFAVERKEVEDGVESDSTFEKLSNKGELYVGYSNQYKTVKLDKGEYVAGVAIRLKQSHYMNESLLNDAGSDLKIKVDGIESNFISTEYLDTLASYDYFALVGLDLFSEDVSEDDEMYTITKDTTIELIGNTTIKTYSPVFEIKNYEQYSGEYGDLIFQVTKIVNGVEEPLMNNAGGNEFTVEELNAFFNSETAEFTYNVAYYAVGHFTNEEALSQQKYGQFIRWPVDDQTGNSVWIFSDWDKKEIAFRFQYQDNPNNVILDFSVFDDLA